MQHLEVSGAVRHIYVIRRLKVNEKGAYIRRDIPRHMRAPGSDKRSIPYKP